jgi:hypothetical protein
MQWLSKLFRKRISLEEQLEILASCGIRLKQNMTPDHILMSIDREALEEEGFFLLLTIMGGEVEEEPFDRLSDNIWHFDMECIEDHGSYIRIAERMRDLAGGSLPLENIEDYVNIEAGEAWLAFQLDGLGHKWDLTVNNDWVDPSLFIKFIELLGSRNTGKLFTYFDVEGQDFLIGCSTRDELKLLRKKTGLKFVELS